MEIHIKKHQPNDKRIWYAQWKTCQVLYRNKMCLKCNTWTLSSNSSYFLLLGIKSSLPTTFWCTYLSVEDCCCCCCCCCCWMEPDDDRWDSLLEVCLWVLSGLDCCWSKPSGLWRILVIVMPSLPPPIPESFFLEMFCSSGEYSWAVNIRVIVKDFYFTTHSHLMACNTERYIYPC